MAGIAIPENLRPVLAAIAKYHFWILAALAPLLLVPLLFVGAGHLRSQIESQRRQIESKLGQARAVTAVQPHPNERWQAAINADTEAVRRETLEAWQRFWHSQQNMRTWPTELGEPFLAAIADLQPNGKLDRRLLISYQNMVPRLARTLPGRMGVEDEMVAAPTEAAAATRDAKADATRGAILAWSPASQQRLYQSFVWTQVPYTTQVVLAQEELWVYGLFCDLIAQFIKESGATGAHDSPLTVVEDLVVGYPAAAPAKQGIFVPKAAGSAEAAPPLDPSTTAGATGQPLRNPRFLGGNAPSTDAAIPGDQPAGSVEDAYRDGIYVDFNGKQLSAAELAAAQDLRMVHLMPFVLRVTIDQRHLDRLLVTLAASPIPIDVREVRVSHGSAATAKDAAAARPNDLVAELRGSVALATRPESTPASQPGAEATP